MGTIINPATNKPFAEVDPDSRVVALRRQILNVLKGKYDAAQTTSQNELHWIQADQLSPDAANSLAVRKKLRSRARYEASNNGYLKGILLTLANDMTGTGPSLQITDPRFTEQQRERIERKWKQRSKSTKLRQKIWRMELAKRQDGETFSFAFNNNSKTFKHRVKVDQRIIECDQVSHYDFNLRPQADNEIDGVRFNKRSGEPEFYHLLNSHPGETLLFSLKPLDGTWVPADEVIHWFRKDRAWLRGIPEVVASLPLWALLRRYTLAVVQNAEIAADFTVLLKSLQAPATNPFNSSGSPLEPSQSNPDDWFNSFPVDRGLMTVLPDMYDLTQLRPEQPVTIYDAFVNALIQEATRCLCTPRNLALGNSGEYNMASGTLDRQLYKGSIDQERLHCGEDVLDHDLEQWWFEAIRISDYFEDEIVQELKTDVPVVSVVRKFQSLRDEPPEHVYRWDEIPEHVDPVKVAMAMDIMHKAGHISDVDIQEGRFNRRVEDHYRNLERQNEWRDENGFSVENPQNAVGNNNFGNDNDNG